VTQDNPPGLTGPVGTSPEAKKSAAAWTNLLHSVFVRAPERLNEAAKYRRLILRAKR
jgi:hypothetical protein